MSGRRQRRMCRRDRSEERRGLAEEMDLTGIVFAGRMPNYRRFRRKVENPQDYLAKVVEGKLHDPVLRFQLANGFEPERIMQGYLPEDKASMANAVMMVWRNPYVERDQPVKKRLPRGVEAVRVATCQLQAPAPIHTGRSRRPGTARVPRAARRRRRQGREPALCSALEARRRPLQAVLRAVES